jgi:hypothetical protein
MDASTCGRQQIAKTEAGEAKFRDSAGTSEMRNVIWRSLARMTRSQKLLPREARVSGQQHASARDSLNVGRSSKVDPCLSDFVRLPALTRFLILHRLQLAR